MKHPPRCALGQEAVAFSAMDPIRCIGGCLPLFVLAVAFDAVGLILLFIGIFADLRIDGRFYGDFLIYTGALLAFFSLGLWLMWYAGNVQVSGDDESGKRRRSVVAMLARKISERLSQRLRGEEGARGGEGGRVGQVGSPPSKASRVTWGKSAVYHNEGYEDSLEEKEMKQEIL